jgi:hypothetical protein
MNDIIAVHAPAAGITLIALGCARGGSPTRVIRSGVISR